VDRPAILEVARRYLRAIERGVTGEELSGFFAPDVDVVPDEFLNLVMPLGKRRDLAEALEGAEHGKRVMSCQIYKITQEMADQDRVALEVEWVGTLSAAFGSIPGRRANEDLCRGVSGFPGREDHQAAELGLL